MLMNVPSRKPSKSSILPPLPENFFLNVICLVEKLQSLHIQIKAEAKIKWLLSMKHMKYSRIQVSKNFTYDIFHFISTSDSILLQNFEHDLTTAMIRMIPLDNLEEDIPSSKVHIPLHSFSREDQEASSFRVEECHSNSTTVLEEGIRLLCVRNSCISLRRCLVRSLYFYISFLFLLNLRRT